MSETIIKPVLHHVTLKTTRLKKMIEWYGAVVGAKPLHEFEGGAWLSNDGANHRIALLAAPQIADDPDKVTHAGMHHTAFEYGSLDDLLRSFERLAELDKKPHLSMDHGTTTSFYYLDPDGNSVELQCDNFGDWGKSSEFMKSRAFARNPIGTGVDPAKMLDARRAGKSAAEVHRAAYAGEYPPAGPMDPRFPIDIPT